MKQSLSGPATGSGLTVELSVEAFLESFREGAVLICPETRSVLHMNARAVQALGEAEGRACHDVLAGLPELCPGCPFEELVSGLAGPVVEAAPVRRGQACAIRVRYLPKLQGRGVILETVENRSVDRVSPLEPRLQPHIDHPYVDMLLGLVLIGRDLLGSSPLAEKISQVLRHLSSAMLVDVSPVAWVELDGGIYGTPSEAVREAVREPVVNKEITVEGCHRGWLRVHFPHQHPVSEEGEYFLDEVTNLIGRQVEISDLESRLRRSEDRYRKLAANLHREVWNRTEALVKETTYLCGILRSSDDIIITTDLDSCIVEFNPGAEKILGYSAEELQGHKISELWMDTDERKRVMEEVKISGSIRNYETKLKARNGEIVEISLTLSLLKDEEGNILGTVGISKDVARERAVRAKLERLNRNYRETIHFISHETKNSLIVIAGFVKRLLDTEKAPERLRQLEIVFHHAKFLEAMSKDFLVMAELEHGGFQVRKELITNLHKQVILPAMVGLKDRYPESFGSYDESMGGVGASRMMGDRALLETVYRNLFGNALKYRKPAGKIAYGVVEHPRHWEFNVWNEGPGVAHDKMERIFDKFYRVPDETTRDKRGTGLGLYNIRRIIEGHGGRIWCVGSPGHWINFIFTLPKE